MLVRVDVVEGIVKLEADGSVAGRRGRWRGSMERFPDGSVVVELRKSLGDAWIPVRSQPVRDAFVGVAARARAAWARGGWVAAG